MSTALSKYLNSPAIPVVVVVVLNHPRSDPFPRFSQNYITHPVMPLWLGCDLLPYRDLQPKVSFLDKIAQPFVL